MIIRVRVVNLRLDKLGFRPEILGGLGRAVTVRKKGGPGRARRFSTLIRAPMRSIIHDVPLWSDLDLKNYGSTILFIQKLQRLRSYPLLWRPVVLQHIIHLQQQQLQHIIHQLRQQQLQHIRELLLRQQQMLLFCIQITQRLRIMYQIQSGIKI